jgi:hypothetical protein
MRFNCVNTGKRPFEVGGSETHGMRHLFRNTAVTTRRVSHQIVSGRAIQHNNVTRALHDIIESKEAMKINIQGGHLK